MEGDTILDELYEQINKMAKFYGKKPSDFSANFTLNLGSDGNHYFTAQVVYEKGQLKK